MKTQKEHLQEIEPQDLSFHSARYKSGEELREAVEMAHNDADPHEVNHQLNKAFDACEDDGSSWGFFPCLGGDIDERVGKAYNAPLTNRE